MSRSAVVTDATLPDNPIVYVNDAFTALTGYTSSEAIGRNCRFLEGPDSDPVVRDQIRRSLAAGESIRRQILNYRKDGTSFWNDLTIDPIRDPMGRVTGYVGIQHQADDLRRANQLKAQAERNLANIADHVPGYLYRRVMRTDGSLELIYCSPSLNRLLGVEEGELRHGFYDRVHPDDIAGLTAAIRRSAAEMSTFREEFRLVSSSGSPHWVRSESVPRRMGNGEIAWEGLALEISAEKRWESEIASQALRDPLTGLMTRSAWRQALAMQVRGAIVASTRCALICIDITGLNTLNDRLGQLMGDEVLRQTAQRLSKIAASVKGVAGRLGGDEFAILIPACAGEAHLSSLSLSVSEALALPLTIGTQHTTIESAVGATLVEDGDQSTPIGDDLASELMMQAEIAVRWAKHEGHNGHVLYSRERDDRFQHRALLSRSLEQAIENQELELHYQPLVHLASGRIVSAEALVRWKHPTLGMQRPDLFIPLAESSGLIVPLGRWVIFEAFRQHRQWQDAGLAPPPIAINVSGNQLDQAFVAFVGQSLLTTGAQARNFEIELTEGLLIEPSPLITESLNALRTMGFTITVDDCGSGHATFRYLRDFPVDKVKIDQVFVRQLVLGSTDALIIRAVIALARSMGIGFIAEGVETEMQRDFLEREGCQVCQGYFFSMPLVAEDFGWLVAIDARLPLRASGSEASAGESSAPVKSRRPMVTR